MPRSLVQKQRSASSDLDNQDAVTPFNQVSAPTPQEPLVTIHADVSVDELSLQEGTALSGLSNVSTGYDESSVESTDGQPSSLRPVPSTSSSSSTVLARRLDKVVRFRSPIPFRRSRYIPHSRHNTGNSGSRTDDELPPPYA